MFSFLSYKDSLPQDTVARIKDILDSAGICTDKQFYNNGDLAYSCRITIANQNLKSLNAGTNGKGISELYSLASGYAELMERLQNKMLLNEAVKYSREKLSFRLYPDESEERSDRKDFTKLIVRFFPNYEAERFENLLPEEVNWLGLPFANLMGNNIETIPILLLRANSSTGMCAGNSPYEAIVQGVNEIFERYVLQQLYLNSITPPSFPSDYFAGTNIYNRLEKLRNVGYLYTVKDCSLKSGFPVVGLILTNTNNGTTAFRLGADLSPEIALERCFTEIFQGRGYGENKFSCREPGAQISLRNEYLKSLKDGTGIFPDSVYGAVPSYDFTNPENLRTGNSHNDFASILEFLHNGGFTLYVRDNSFLGFPTYHLFIPGLSDQYPLLNDVYAEFVDYINHADTVWPLYQVKKQKTDEDLERLLRIIGNKYHDQMLLTLFPYNEAISNNVSRDLLSFMLHLKHKDYTYAAISFDNFMRFRKMRGGVYNAYLNCIGEYIKLKSNGATQDTVRNALSPFYLQSIIDEVLSDFEGGGDIMKNYRFPECFDCESCPISDSCRYSDVISFERIIQTQQLRNTPSQEKLLNL